MKRKEISGSEELSRAEKKRLKKEQKRLEQEEQEGGKKKKRSCCGCLVIMAIVFVVLIAAGTGAGYYFGNSYLKKNYGVSIKETVSVVKALYDGDREKIVTNAPSDTDEASFYATLNDALFLTDGTLDKDSFSDLISGSSSDTGSGENSALEIKGLLLSDGSANTLDEIFVRANIDQNKLARFNDEYDYELSYDTDFVVSVTDRQLMAMLKPMIEEAFADNEEMAANVAVEQLTLSRTDDDVPVMKIIVSIKLKSLIASLTADSGIPGIARTLIKSIMPKELFVSVSLTLGETTTGDISINEMSQARLDVAHKLITAVAKKDSHQVINDFITENLQPTIDEMDKLLSFDKNIGAGKMNFDIFSLIASSAFDGEASGSDMALLYTSVLKASTEKMLEDNKAEMFENQYRVGDDTVYSVTPVDGGTLIDYRDEFMNELSSKYLVATEFYRDPTGKVYLPRALNGTFKDGDDKYISVLYMKDDGSNEVTGNVDAEHPTELSFTELEFDDVAALLGIGSSESAEGLELQALFDAAGLTRKIGGSVTEDKSEWYINQNVGELKLRLTDKMLAALVDAQTGSVLGEDSTLTSSLKLRFITLATNADVEQVELTDGDGNYFEPKQYKEVKRSYMTMGFTVNTAQLFGDMDLISGLLEEELGLIATVELTPELDVKYLTAPVLRYADLSAKRTSEMIDVLVKAGMDSLTSEKIQELIGTPVRDAIITMRDTLGGIELDSAVIVPDVFTLLTEQMFPRDEQKKIEGTVIEFGDGEIKGLLEALYDIPEITTTGGKTYLTKDGTYGGVFGTGLDNVTGKVDTLNTYISLSSSLSPGITLPELHSDLGKVVGYYYDSVNKKMFLAYEYSLAQYLGGDSSASGLLTVEKIYATFEITFSAEGGIATVLSSKMTVNRMTDEKKDTLDKMLTYLDEGNEDMLSDLESNVGGFALGVKKLDDNGKLNDSSGD